VDAVVAHDETTLAKLEKQYRISHILKDGIRFQKTTIHGSSLASGSRALYGDLSEAELVSASTQQRIADFPGLYDRALALSDTSCVLTDIPRIDAAQWSSQRYKPIARIDPYLYPLGHPDFIRRGSDTPRFRRIFSTVLHELLEDEGLAEIPTDFNDYLAFVRTSITNRHNNGFVGLKIASAYVRTLEFVRRDYRDAEAAYATLHGDDVDPTAYRILADYLVFAIAEQAAAEGLPIQIHTGMGHSEPGLTLRNADPRNLDGLLSDRALNQLPIILIHGGYPYTSYVAALSQAHGNVYTDFSWMPYLQHHTVERLLQEWLEVLPANKVLFGTDTGQPEFHVAATERSRLLLDRVLTSGVTDRLWTVSQAEWLAHRVFHENLAAIYRLDS
jgi:predicted TIM-barrel fold metal-dependent hydrolase